MPSGAEVAAAPCGAITTYTHGLHLAEPGSHLWRERLAFRDNLRADPALATEYADLNVRLAKEHGIEVEVHGFGHQGAAASTAARKSDTLRANSSGWSSCG
jgi:GrpB-like predicted nucleotidyltransferase (UPF0157 family)